VTSLRAGALIDHGRLRNYDDFNELFPLTMKAMMMRMMMMMMKLTLMTWMMMTRT
jgi:hypothetical protein